MANGETTMSNTKDSEKHTEKKKQARKKTKCSRNAIRNNILAEKRLFDNENQREEIAKILNSNVFEACSVNERQIEKKYTDDFYISVMKNEELFKSEETDKYAQIALNFDMRVCYANVVAQNLFSGIECNQYIDKYAQIEGFSRVNKEKLPMQTAIHCEKGVFMCIVSEITAGRSDYYFISIAYSEKRTEKGLYSFLSSKLAIMNLRALNAKRHDGKHRTDKQMMYISDKFDKQAQKALKIQALMSSPAVITSKNEIASAREYLNNIAERYFAAIKFRTGCTDRDIFSAFSVECAVNHYLGITPVFAMATVYLIDAVYSISKTGYVVLGAEKDPQDEMIDIITFKTAVSRNIYESVLSLSDELTDKEESEFYRMFFANVISQYAKPPKLSVKGGELIVKLYLPRKTADYILRNYTSTLRRFSYLDAMFAMLELEKDDLYGFYPEN